MKINLLRQKILDLAIRGKLVPQDPNDEPASVLLERIRAEKDRLIAEGKIKRPKKSKATSSESHYQQFEPPFDIPESWEWVRLGDVCLSITAGGDKPFNFSKYKTEKFTIPIFSNGIEKDGLYGYTDRATIDEESITISARGTIGFCKIRTEPYVPIIRLLVVIPSKLLSIDYLLLAISSLINTGEGSSIPQLTVPTIKEVYLPLPPYPEQLKITKKFDEINNEIEIINRENIQLTYDINLAKSKILDLAMQGKLVPQDPSDEPAADMLRRINPKAKIITDNQQYQQLPSKWCIAAIKDVFEINPKNKADEEIEAGFVPMASIADGFNDSFDYASRKWKEIKKGFTHFADGDIAVAKISPCLENRKSMILKNLPNGIGSGTTELLVFRSHAVYPEYGLLFFKSDSFINHCVGTFNGVVGQQRVGKNIVEDIHIPIPPLNEQKRIVKKVRDLFSLLVEIESNLLIAKS